jgi:hypothetical protein
MVETQFIPTIRKQLEKFLISKNDFQLRGQNYELILLVPSDRYSMDTKYSLFISSKQFDQVQRKAAISELLSFFKESLTLTLYNTLSRIDFIHSEDPLVRNLKMIFALPHPMFVIQDISVGGVTIELGYLLKSQILDKLIEGDAVSIVYEINGTVQSTNAGIIKINRDFELIYYTGKGLKEMWEPANDKETRKAKELQAQTEDYLEDHGYVGRIPFDAILKLE